MVGHREITWSSDFARNTTSISFTMPYPCSRRFPFCVSISTPHQYLHVHLWAEEFRVAHTLVSSVRCVFLYPPPALTSFKLHSPATFASGLFAGLCLLVAGRTPGSVSLYDTERRALSLCSRMLPGCILHGAPILQGRPRARCGKEIGRGVEHAKNMFRFRVHVVSSISSTSWCFLVTGSLMFRVHGRSS